MSVHDTVHCIWTIMNTANLMERGVVEGVEEGVEEGVFSQVR